MPRGTLTVTGFDVSVQSTAPDRIITSEMLDDLEDALVSALEAVLEKKESRLLGYRYILRIGGEDASKVRARMQREKRDMHV